MIERIDVLPTGTSAIYKAHTKSILPKLGARDRTHADC